MSVLPYLDTGRFDAREIRKANEAAREQTLIDELRYWTAQAAKAEPDSDRWHECMDEMDSVKCLLRKS
jgi:hypothetical protein